MANASPSFQNGGKADPTDLEHWDKASAQAAAVLSGPQLALFNAEAQGARAVRLIKQFYQKQGTAK